MDGEEPGGEDVEEVVKAVGVSDAVDGGVQRREEHEEVRDVSYTGGSSVKVYRPQFHEVHVENVPASDSGSHMTHAHHFHNKHQRQHSQQIVMRAERSQPVNSKVVDPDNEHGHVDWQHPEHEYKHRSGVVVEIIVCARVSVAGKSQCSYARAQLHDGENHVSELVWYEGRDEQEKNGCCDESLAAAG